MEKIQYGGWPNCVRLTNGRIELVVTTDVGPRVIRFGFVGAKNLFKEWPEQLGLTGGDEWRVYGGHRFWHAPEIDPRSYQPDNNPVAFRMRGNTLKLVQPVEPATGMAKEMEIAIEGDNGVRVLHRLINRNMWEVEVAPWALSVMAPGGFAVFPQEPFRPHPEYLLPARPVVIWHYTDMGDARFTWGEKYIILRQDPAATKKNKVGLANARGWAAYCLKGDVFVKTYPYDPAARYVDFGCNTESFTNEEMLEVESIGPLVRIAPGGKAEHVERWYLHKARVADSEKSIDKNLLPLVTKAGV